MQIGRLLASATACALVGGCAAVVFAMTHTQTTGAQTAADSRASLTTAAPTSRPAFVPVSRAAAPPSRASSVPSASPPSGRSAAASSVPVVSSTPKAPTTRSASTAVPTAIPLTTAPASTRASPAVAHAAPRQAVATPAPASRTSTRTIAPAAATKPRGRALPLRYSTGSATRVLTVTAHSSSSTVATLQQWQKASGGGWTKVGSAVTAHIGADGMGRASESTSKTPVGSFTLTQAFGHNADPGTTLPYFRTTPSDYWISSSGSRYNTHQRCSTCGYDNGVNERLYYETPYYNYAVVINYNTRDAPGGVHAGRGSAFFLHVSVGRSTAGCVAISQRRLISIMKWLHPSNHPRILIGTV